MFFTLRPQHFPQLAVGGHASRQNDLVLAHIHSCAYGLGYDNVQYRRLEAGCHISRIRFSSCLTFRVHVIKDAGLDAAEAEIQTSLFQEHALEFHGMRISFFGQLVDEWAARVSQTQYASYFIVSFSRRIVSGGAQHVTFVVVGHLYDVGVTAGNDQSHERRFQLLMLDIVGADVSLNVVYSYQRLARRQGIGLGSGQTDEQSSYQTRTVGNADHVYIVQRDLCSFQSLIHHRVDIGQVVSRCDLRHDAAV